MAASTQSPAECRFLSRRVSATYPPLLVVACGRDQRAHSLDLRWAAQPGRGLHGVERHQVRDHHAHGGGGRGHLGAPRSLRSGSARKIAPSSRGSATARPVSASPAATPTTRRRCAGPSRPSATRRSRTSRARITGRSTSAAAATACAHSRRSASRATRSTRSCRLDRDLAPGWPFGGAGRLIRLSGSLRGCAKFPPPAPGHWPLYI